MVQLLKLTQMDHVEPPPPPLSLPSIIIRKSKYFSYLWSVCPQLFALIVYLRMLELSYQFKLDMKITVTVWYNIESTSTI